MQSEAKTVKDYIQSFDSKENKVLLNLSKLFQEIFPEFSESMKYKMPTYVYDDYYYAFAKQKHYFSIYLRNQELMQKYTSKFEKATFGKNCIRFRSISKYDIELLRELLLEDRFTLKL
ncbi:MAG: DUF1801 domain-containing protein [Asgard group archaeon]|nr:DUF1801 domain-containing protein [Asgard group archaeon]